MKKKIILMLCVLALFVCVFAISVSATSVYFTDEDNSNFVIENYVSGGGSYYTTPLIFPEFKFITFEISCYSPSTYSYSYWCSDVEAFQLKYKNCDYTTFYEEWANNYQTCIDENVFNYFMSWAPSKGEFTEEDLQAKYDEGYTQGKKDGVTNYENITLPTLLQSAKVEGVVDYKKSKEYSNILESEYDNGYEAAQEEIDKKEAKNMLGTALGSFGIVVFVLLGVWLWLTLSKKKKRRR